MTITAPNADTLEVFDANEDLHILTTWTDDESGRVTIRIGHTVHVEPITRGQLRFEAIKDHDLQRKIVRALYLR